MRREDSPSKSFEELIRDLEAGNPSAAEVVWGRYALRICQLAEREIGRRLQARFDAEDIMQSTLGSFFRRATNGEFRFDHSGALWNLLTTITLNKIRRQANYHRAMRRDVDAEADIDIHLLEGRVISPDSEAQKLEARQLAEAVESVVEKLKPRDAEFFRLRYREGLSAVDISNRTSWSVATINRLLKRTIDRIRHRLENE